MAKRKRSGYAGYYEDYTSKYNSDNSDSESDSPSFDLPSGGGYAGAYDDYSSSDFGIALKEQTDQENEARRLAEEDRRKKEELRNKLKKGEIKQSLWGKITDKFSDNSEMDQAKRATQGRDLEDKRSLMDRTKDMFDANSEVDKAKRMSEGKPELYQDEQGRGYSGVGGRIRDIFDANSGRDKTIRRERGDPELYQDWVKQKDELQMSAFKGTLTDAQKNETTTGDETGISRRQFFKDDQGLDIDNPVLKDLVAKYGDKFDIDKLSSQELADAVKKAKEGGLVDSAPNEKELLPGAEQSKNQDYRDQVYRQLLKKVADPNIYHLAEKRFQNARETERGQKSGIQRLAERFNAGAKSALDPTELTRGVKSVAGNTIESVFGDTTLGNYGENWAKGAAVDEERAKMATRREGMAASKYDSYWADLAEGGGNLVGQLALGGITGGGAVPSISLGVQSGGDTMGDIRMNGGSAKKALGIGIANGTTQAVLEKIGLDKVIGEGGEQVLKKFLVSSVSEGSQEFLQAIAQSGAESTYKKVDWTQAFDSAVQQGFAGALLGGVAGFGTLVASDLRQQGVSEGDAKEIGDVADQYVNEAMRRNGTAIVEENNAVKQDQQQQQEEVPQEQVSQGQYMFDRNPMEQAKQVMSQPTAETSSGRTQGEIVPSLNARTELAKDNEVNHITSATKLASIINDGKLTTSSPDAPGYEGQNAVYLQKGNNNSYGYGGEDNVKIVYDVNSLPQNTVQNGDELAVQQDLPVTPDTVQRIEVGNENLAKTLRDKGFNVVVDTTLSARRKGSVKSLNKEAGRPYIDKNGDPRDATGKAITIGKYQELTQDKALTKMEKDINSGKGSNYKSLKTSEAKINKPEGRQLKETKKGVKQIIDADARQRLEAARSSRDLLKEVKAVSKGVKSSNDWENIPQSFKNKDGLGADELADALGFASENDFVAAMQDYAANTDRKMTLKEAKQQAQDALDRGISPYSQEYKKMMEKVGRLTLEEERLGGRLVENKPTSKADQSKTLTQAKNETPREMQTPPETATFESKSKSSTLAKKINQRAVENKLTQTFEGLPEYDTVNVKDQIDKAYALYEFDENQAIDIALGKIPNPPDGILPETMLKVIEDSAIRSGNVDLLRRLATESTLSGEASVMGQRLRMLAERDPNSAVAKIQEVAKARIKAAENSLKGETVNSAIKKEVKAIKEATPKVTKLSWNQFIEGIQC